MHLRQAQFSWPEEVSQYPWGLPGMFELLEAWHFLYSSHSRQDT